MSVRRAWNKSALSFITLKLQSLPRITIKNLRRRVRRYEPAPGFLNAMLKPLLSPIAKYHIERGARKQHATCSNILIGQLSKAVLLV